MQVLGYAAWRMRIHPGWPAWAAFLLYATVGFRLVVIKETSWVGLADDAALACLLGFGASQVSTWAHLPRLLLLALLGMCLVTYNLCNALFYGFFDSLLNLDSWRLLTQVDGAHQSVRAVFTTRIIALHIATPLLLLALALWRSRHPTPRVGTPLRHALVPCAVALILLQGRVASSLPLASENNGILVLGRQWTHRLLMGRNSNAVRADIFNRLEETYALPPSSQYKTRTDPAYPLLKVPVNPTTTPRKPLNVVLILMESVRLTELGFGQEKDKVAPRLEHLANNGMYFTRFYANTHQTVRGEFTTLCGALSNYGAGQEYSMFEDLGIACLPSVLKDQGYQTWWISSYHADYANKRGFHALHGIDNFRDIQGIKQRKLKHPVVGWGPSDEDLAGYAVDTLNKARQPFFAEVMTLSNHHPFLGPFDVERISKVEDSAEPRIYKNYVAGMQYTDKAVGMFMDLARRQAWFDNTLFVILGDHSVWLFPEAGARRLTPAEQIEVYHRTPLIFYAPKHIPPSQHDTLGSQTDLAPTILDVLGVAAPNAFEGVSLLAPVPHHKRTVMVGNESGWSIRQGDNYCYRTGIECFDSFPPQCPPGYERKRAAHTCFTTAQDMLTLGPQPVPVTLLGEREAAGLLGLGQKLVENHSQLLLQDALFPRQGAQGGPAAASPPGNAEGPAQD